MDNGDLKLGQIEITGLKSINILLGRNGAGKSRLLRAVDEELSRNKDINVRYISPERAGVFKRDGNVMTNMENDPNWIGDVRRKNQAENFKAASANLLREVETAYLRQLQDDPDVRFNNERNFRTDRLDSINRLLSNIRISQEGSNFLFKTLDGQEIQPEQISSGESESISLAVEMMYFFDNLKENQDNILLLDEPDVHLHPDLQARLATFLMNLIQGLDELKRKSVKVILATHSTPLICALSRSEFVALGTKNFGIDSVSFVEVSKQLKKVAPFFGHPLSLSLSGDTMLILEGDDDERVWQQAARTSQGRIKVFPVVASSVDQQTELEQFTADLIESLYDEPKAFSLRDGDGKTEALSNIGAVERYRLQCYAAENLLLTDQCLGLMGKTWEEFKGAAKIWIEKNEQHKDIEIIKELIESADRLRHEKIKSIRQIICAICESNKPWEVVVGQAIGSLDVESLPNGDFDLPTFIGLDATTSLLSR